MGKLLKTELHVSYVREQQPAVDEPWHLHSGPFGTHHVQDSMLFLKLLLRIQAI